MDTTIGFISKSVVEAMSAANYMGSTISVYKKYFKYLGDTSEDGLYTKEIGRVWASSKKKASKEPYCDNVRSFKRRIVRICDVFVDHGIIDLSCERNAPPDVPESSTFKAILVAYERDNEIRGLAPGTKDYYWRLAREYLLFLESATSIFDIDNADPASILSFMADILSRWRGTDSYHIGTNFRPFLKFLKRPDLVEALKMTNMVRKRRIVPMLSDVDEEAVAQACCSRLVPSKDAAITLLALTTGMRACDIINLRISDIEWRCMTISIIQQKTGNPLIVPIASDVAKALADYLLYDRPDTEFDHVFIRNKAPYTPYHDHASIYAVTKRVFEAAGVKGCAGTMLLRHNAASKMVRSGVRLPVVSAMLGHADQDTTNDYIETDMEHMRACVLPLPEGAHV